MLEGGERGYKSHAFSICQEKNSQQGEKLRSIFRAKVKATSSVAPSKSFSAFQNIMCDDFSFDFECSSQCTKLRLDNGVSVSYDVSEGPYNSCMDFVLSGAIYLFPSRTRTTSILRKKARLIDCSFHLIYWLIDSLTLKSSLAFHTKCGVDSMPLES